MLTIRSEQVEELDDSIAKDLAAAIRTHLERHHADALQAAGAGADGLIAKGIEACRSLGLERKSAFLWFVATMLEVGPRFYEHVHIRELLTDENVPQEDRVASMLQLATTQDWEEAAEL